MDLLQQENVVATGLPLALPLCTFLSLSATTEKKKEEEESSGHATQEISGRRTNASTGARTPQSSFSLDWLHRYSGAPNEQYTAGYLYMEYARTNAALHSCPHAHDALHDLHARPLALTTRSTRTPRPLQQIANHLTDSHTHNARTRTHAHRRATAVHTHMAYG